MRCVWAQAEEASRVEVEVEGVKDGTPSCLQIIVAGLTYWRKMSRVSYFKLVSAAVASMLCGAAVVHKVYEVSIENILKKKFEKNSNALCVSVCLCQLNPEVTDDDLTQQYLYHIYY